MKVLHVAETVAGGVASHLNELLPPQQAGYGKNNVRLLLPASQRSHLDPALDNCLEAFEDSGRSLRSLLALAIAIYRLTRSFSPDVIHLHSTYAGFIGRVVLILTNNKGRVVYTPHGWSFLRHDSKFKLYIYGVFERRLLSLTDAIVCVSDGERVAAIENGLSPCRLKVIKNGIAAPKSRCENGYENSEKIRCIFIGRFDRQKGVDVLFDMIEGYAKKLTAYQFDFVGDSILENFSPKNFDFQDDLDVSFHGWLERKAALSLLANADLLIMPSRWEGLPMVAIEALALGVPILGSEISPLDELIEEDVTGLFWAPSSGAEGLFEVLASVSKERLTKMRLHCQAKYESEYTAEIMCCKTMGLYADIFP